LHAFKTILNTQKWSLDSALARSVAMVRPGACGNPLTKFASEVNVSS
jgi:hypothetical protein